MVPLARYLPCPLEAAYPNSLTRHEMRVFRCWVSTSRCRARLTLRSPPTRTRRALSGRHAAADGLRRIISSLAGCVRTAGANSILHSARMILSDVLTCTVPPLRVESSLLKNPIPPNLPCLQRVEWNRSSRVRGCMKTRVQATSWQTTTDIAKTDISESETADYARTPIDAHTRVRGRLQGTARRACRRRHCGRRSPFDSEIEERYR